MPTGRDSIFIGYDTNTWKQYWVYCLDLHRTVILSHVTFFEDTPGRQIENFRLWIETSDKTFIESEGHYNLPLVRNRVGAPRKNLSLTVDSI